MYKIGDVYILLIYNSEKICMHGLVYFDMLCLSVIVTVINIIRKYFTVLRMSKKYSTCIM